VEDLHKWIVQHFQEHPLFEKIAKQDLVSITVYFMCVGNQLIFFFFINTGSRPYSGKII